MCKVIDVAWPDICLRRLHGISVCKYVTNDVCMYLSIYPSINYTYMHKYIHIYISISISSGHLEVAKLLVAAGGRELLMLTAFGGSSCLELCVRACVRACRATLGTRWSQERSRTTTG